MRSMPTSVRSVLLFFVLAAVPGHLFPEEVGHFAIVQNEVTSLRPDAAAPIPARAGATIVLNEEESTGAASAAKMTFGEWGVISVGQRTKFKITREAVAEATGESVSALELLAGKARIFVSRLVSGRPEIRVNTPSAVVGIKGSEVVVEILPDGGTVVTVLSGSATVRARTASGDGRSLRRAESASVSAIGGPLADSTQVSPEQIAALREETEPVPTPPRDPPDNPPAQDPPAVAGGTDDSGRLVINTTAISSAGSVLAAPAATAVPPPPAVQPPPMQPPPLQPPPMQPPPMQPPSDGQLNQSNHH